MVESGTTTTTRMSAADIVARWRGGLIVSCQAATGSPLARPEIIAALALVAEQNGAVGVRIDGAANIACVRAQTALPVLGIEKRIYQGSDVYITPTFDCAARVAQSGADVIALDATPRARPQGESFARIVARIRAESGLPVMADVATYEEGVRAIEEDGADFVGTTLAGYTRETAAANEEPALPLVERLARRLDAAVICEGRLRSCEHVRRAFSAGAHTVVIGTAITGVDHLVRDFVAATPKASED